MIFGSSLTDIETCYKAIRSSVLRNLDLHSDGFEIEGEITAKLLRDHYRIAEIPITYVGRRRSAGKKIRWWDGLRTFLTLLRVRFSVSKKFAKG
jgi:hypothetical protein